MVVGNNELTATKNCRQMDGNFDCHGNVAVRCGVHRQMEHIQGFTRSHWMPPSGKRLRRIALAAAMVKEYE
jgi:hypothetical protein